MKRNTFLLLTCMFFLLSILGDTNTVLGVIFKIAGEIYIPMLSLILADISAKLFEVLTDSGGKWRKIISALFITVWNLFIGFILNTLIPIFAILMYMTGKNHIKRVYFGVVLSSVLSVVNPYYMLLPLAFVFIHLYMKENKVPSQN